MKLVYVAHPVSHADPRIVESNVGKIERIAREIARAGDVPVCSALLVPYDTFPNDEEHYLLVMEMAIALVAKCDELLICHEQVSRGMEVEIAFARAQGIPVGRYRLGDRLDRATAEVPIAPATEPIVPRGPYQPCAKQARHTFGLSECRLPRFHQVDHVFEHVEE
jgi:nucleoside 2-deoxyribosyltransferase